MTTLPALVIAFAVGVIAQARLPVDRPREILWHLYFHVIVPVLVLATFVDLDVAADLLLTLAVVVVASWSVCGLAYRYGGLVARDRGERGAVTLAGAFGNTNAVGLPIAQLTFGAPGLELAVVYDRLAWLVPAQGVSASIARAHGTSSLQASVRLGDILLTNTPLHAMVIALGLRAADVEIPGLDVAREIMIAIVGPIAFLLLGLSLPLVRLSHTREDVRITLGAVAIRVVGGPLAVLLLARTTTIHVPGPFYLLAGMPCAFHLLTLARIYDLRPELIRLAIVLSTGIVLLAVGAMVLVR